MRRVALRAPIGLVAAAQRIVELQKLDDTIPAIAEQRVEALGMDRHRGAARREILGQRAQRQLDQHDRRGFERFDEPRRQPRSEEHTSELQSLMRLSYAVIRLKK